MKLSPLILLAAMLILASCTSGDPPPPETAESHAGSGVSAAESGPQGEAPQSRASGEETFSGEDLPPEVASPPVEDGARENVYTPGQPPEAVDAPAMDVEQALADQLEYLQGALYSTQHGGIHRISDYNGSGLGIHGGPDRGDPYILVWVIDQAAVDAALAAYTGPSVEVTCKGAHYSLAQLEEIMEELRAGELAPYLHSIVLGSDNLVLLSADEENRERVEDFLAAYPLSHAVACYYAHGGWNPDT